MQWPETVVDICREVARSKTEGAGDNIQWYRVDLVVSVLHLSPSRTTHLSCRRSVAKLFQKGGIEVVGRVVESHNAKVHCGPVGGRQQLRARHDREDSRNPNLPISRTSGPVHTVHLGIALTVIHQAPHQHLVLIWSQEPTVCWPVCEPPIHDDTHADSDTSLDDEYPSEDVSSLTDSPKMSWLTISIHRIL